MIRGLTLAAALGAAVIVALNSSDGAVGPDAVIIQSDQ